jgi:FkbM family methyltransferase
MSVLNAIKNIVNPLGIDIVKYPSLDLRRRQKLLKHFNINKIIDVGANSGQYALGIRKTGFKGDILSFEPVEHVFNKLKKRANKDSKWKVHNLALGNKQEELEINVSKNTYSSSILNMMPEHLKNAPEALYLEKEIIKVDTLDNMFKSLVSSNDVVLLKLDVQGFEKNVLEGAKESLKSITGVQIEMSVIEMYEGELTYLEMINYLSALGFSLYSLENGFFNTETGQLLQVDGVFFRNK